MRIMKASPGNRQRVYAAVRAYWFDSRQGIGVDTLATRVGLPIDIVEACCEVLEAATVLTRVAPRADHPTYRPTVVR